MAFYSVSGLTGPNTARIGTGVYSQAIVENTGSESGSQDITHTIDENTQTIKSSLSLDPNESQMVVAFWDVPDSTGTFSYSINSNDSVASDSVSAVDDLSDANGFTTVVDTINRPLSYFVHGDVVSIRRPIEHFALATGDVARRIDEIIDDGDEDALQEIIDILLEDGPFKVSNFVFADNKDPLMLLDENYVPTGDGTQ